MEPFILKDACTLSKSIFLLSQKVNDPLKATQSSYLPQIDPI